MIAAFEELRDTPSETHAIRKETAPILRGTGKFESVDLLFFWSERISSVFFLFENVFRTKKQLPIKQ